VLCGVQHTTNRNRLLIKCHFFYFHITMTRVAKRSTFLLLLLLNTNNRTTKGIGEQIRKR
jgi:hypothetical protein